MFSTVLNCALKHLKHLRCQIADKVGKIIYNSKSLKIDLVKHHQLHIKYKLFDFLNFPKHFFPHQNKKKQVIQCRFCMCGHSAEKGTVISQL